MGGYIDSLSQAAMREHLAGCFPQRIFYSKADMVRMLHAQATNRSTYQQSIDAPGHTDLADETQHKVGMDNVQAPLTESLHAVARIYKLVCRSQVFMSQRHPTSSAIFDSYFTIACHLCQTLSGH